ALRVRGARRADGACHQRHPEPGGREGLGTGEAVEGPRLLPPVTVLSRRLGFLLPLAVVLAILLLYLAAPIPVQVLRNAAFDQYQRWQPRPYADTPVRVVDSDEQSLARRGRGPWPRERLAELVRRLHDAGAAATAFDVVFAESDRVSPRALASHWGLEGTVAEAIGG